MTGLFVFILILPQKILSSQSYFKSQIRSCYFSAQNPPTASHCTEENPAHHDGCQGASDLSCSLLCPRCPAPHAPAILVFLLLIKLGPVSGPLCLLFPSELFYPQILSSWQYLIQASADLLAVSRSSADSWRASAPLQPQGYTLRPPPRIQNMQKHVLASPWCKDGKCSFHTLPT